MRMRMILMALCGDALWGQAILDPPPLGIVGQYLQVDSAQANAIARNNRDHENWRQQKERRIYQVRSEIAEVTQRSPLDPMSLGLPHAEIEAICREIDEREKQVVKVNRDVLNETQKLKLAALEEAMKLAPVANEGAVVRLIDAAPMPFSNSNGFADFLLGRAAATWPKRARTGACGAVFSTRLLGLAVQQ